MRKRQRKAMRTCKRCGSQLADGFCPDKTCPFSDHLQTCPTGWVNYPNPPSCGDNMCNCGGRIKAEVPVGSDGQADHPHPCPGPTEPGTDPAEPRTIVLPCFGIVVRLVRDQPGHPGRPLAGDITSNLHESDSGSEDDSDYEAAMDGIESLILAHACAGVDIAAPTYIAGIQTAVEAASANL